MDTPRASPMHAQQSLHEWILSELPSIPPIQPETLEFLTQGQAAEELFHFITTRIHTEEHTKTIRGVLALTDHCTGRQTPERPAAVPVQTFQHNADAADAVDIPTLHDQIEQLQNRLSTLRTQLASRPGAHTAHATQDDLNDGYENVFRSPSASASATRTAAQHALADSLSASCAAARSALPMLRELLPDESDLRSPTSSPSTQTAQPGNLHDRLTGFAHELLQDVFDDVMLDAEVASLVDGDIPSVTSALLASVRESARVRTAGLSTSGLTAVSESSATAVLEEAYAVSRDLQLRAAATCRAQMHEARTCRERAESVLKAGDGRVRDLRAQFAKLEGERALLTYATSAVSNADAIAHSMDHGSDFDTMAALRVQREAGVMKGEQRVCELEAVVSRLVQGSLRSLAEVRRTGVDMGGQDDLVRERVLSAVQVGRRNAGEVEKAMAETEQWVGDANDVGDRVEKEEESLCGSAEQVRESEAQAWRAECERVCRGLEVRADVAVENRAQVVQRFEQDLLERVARALEAARSCREKEAVGVQQAMRSWVVEPGKEAAHWLFQSRDV